VVNCWMSLTLAIARSGLELLLFTFRISITVLWTMKQYLMIGLRAGVVVYA